MVLNSKKHPDRDTVLWISRELAAPRVAYTIREWSILTGLATKKLRAFMRSATLLPDPIKGSRRQHRVTVADFRREWPKIWRASQARCRDLSGEIEEHEDDEAA